MQTQNGRSTFHTASLQKEPREHCLQLQSCGQASQASDVMQLHYIITMHLRTFCTMCTRFVFVFTEYTRKDPLQACPNFNMDNFAVLKAGPTQASRGIANFPLITSLQLAIRFCVRCVYTCHKRSKCNHCTAVTATTPFNNKFTNRPL